MADCHGFSWPAIAAPLQTQTQFPWGKGESTMLHWERNTAFYKRERIEVIRVVPPPS